MRNRVISVPKDANAESALDFNEAKASQLLEFSLREDEFFMLYQKGIFDNINYLGNTSIDDFEDAYVKGDVYLKKVINFLKQEEYEDIPVLKNICDLFEEALTRKTGVHFFF